MQPHPLVSIIIPVWNTPEPYLRQCIESCLNQTYTNIELILVDNQSTDGSWDIIQEYTNKDKRIISFRTEGYGGPNWARRDGVNRSSGEWIVFCDSDDWYEANAVEVLLGAAVDKKGRVKADVVVGGAKMPGNPDWCPYPVKQDQIYSRQKRDTTLALLIYGTSWGRMFKASVIQPACFPNEKIYLSEDVYMNIQIAFNANRVLAIADRVYNYREREGSLWKKSTQAERDERMGEILNIALQKRYIIPNIGLEADYYTFLPEHAKEAYQIYPTLRYAKLLTIKNRLFYLINQVRWRLLGHPQAR